MPKDEYKKGLKDHLAKIQSIVWYDPKTWKSKIHTKTEEEYLAAVIKYKKKLVDNMQRYYSRTQTNEEIYQYRSAMAKEADMQTEADGGWEDIQENCHLTFNLIRACCSTATNKIAKQKPKVTFLTKGATIQQSRTAKILDDWIFKRFKKGEIYSHAPRAFLSACLSALGVLKIFRHPEKGFKFKKINARNFFCDYPYKGRSNPKTAGDIVEYSFHDLLEMYPKKETQLKEAHGGNDYVDVTYIYRSYKRYVVFTDKVLLEEGEWKYEHPYEFMRWSPATEGAVGVALAEEIMYLQDTITYILNRVLKSVHLFAVPRVFVQKGGMPTDEDIGNETGEYVEVNMESKIPVFHTPPAINDQVYKMIFDIWDKAFEQTGLSQTDAYGQMPAGLRQASGTALRNYSQLTNERFQLTQSSYENLFVRVAKKMIKMCPDKDLPGISRKDIDSAEENITVFASNILPETPAGRMALVSDMYNSGLITKEQSLQLIDSKDTDRFISSSSKRVQAIEMELEKAVSSGQKPDISSVGALGIELYLDKTRKKYAEIMLEKGTEDPNLIMLANFMEEITQKLQEQAQEAAMAQGGAPPPSPNENLSLEAGG